MHFFYFLNIILINLFCNVKNQIKLKHNNYTINLFRFVKLVKEVCNKEQTE